MNSKFLSKVKRFWHVGELVSVFAGMELTLRKLASDLMEGDSEANDIALSLVRSWRSLLRINRALLQHRLGEKVAEEFKEVEKAIGKAAKVRNQLAHSAHTAVEDSEEDSEMISVRLTGNEGLVRERAGFSSEECREREEVIRKAAHQLKDFVYMLKEETPYMQDMKIEGP